MIELPRNQARQWMIGLACSFDGEDYSKYGNGEMGERS